MAFVASIGSLYGDGGLLSLLVDSEVYADDTARRMLQGKQYTRGVRGIKLVHEALFRMLYSSMQSWIKSQGRSLESQDRDQKLQELRDAFTAKDVMSATRIVNEE
jgi:hypothetical protein